MKVMLIQPTIEKGKSGFFDEPYAKPPLGLAYIASTLEKESNEVSILDMYSTNKNMGQLLEEVKRQKPDVVGFSVNTPYIVSVNKYAHEIKKFFNIPIVVGGPHPSSIPERTILENPSIDVAVFGEGEETMKELVQKLEEGKSLEGVKGIAYRNDGRVILNPPRPLIMNLDEIPFPAWHLLDMELYLNALSSKRTFHVFTTRGCPGRCMFCDSHKIWQRKIRYRSPSNILKEFKELKSRYKVDHIIIQDDTFVLSKKRLCEFCDLLIEEDLNLTWECKGRVDRADKEILIKMKESGCAYIAYGAESGSQEVLDYIKKDITVEQIRNAVQLTREIGISVGTFWMMGFPPEKEEHVKQTLNLALELDTDTISRLSILVPFPGTDLYPLLKKEGLILDENWEKYFKVHNPGEYPMPSIRTRYLSAEDLLRIKKEVDKKLGRHIKKKLIKQQLKRSPQLFLNFLKNPKAFTRRSIIFARGLIH